MSLIRIQNLVLRPSILLFFEANQIRYYSVATPVTVLYFKTTIKKGQSVDAFISLTTSENLNFSIAYKDLRSEGEYLNQLSSTGNLGLLPATILKTNVMLQKHIIRFKIS